MESKEQEEEFETVDVDELFKDHSGSDFSLISSDEEELSKVDFTDSEYRILCNDFKCYVDLTRRNLYYICEKTVRRKMGIQHQPMQCNKLHKIVKKKLKKSFNKYREYFLEWENNHNKMKMRLLRERKRRAIQYLNKKCETSSTCDDDNIDTLIDKNKDSNNLEDDDTTSSSISIKTVIEKESQNCHQEDIEENSIRDDSFNSFLHNSEASNSFICSPSKCFSPSPLNPINEFSYSQFDYNFENFAAIHPSQQVTSTQG